MGLKDPSVLTLGTSLPLSAFAPSYDLDALRWNISTCFKQFLISLSVQWKDAKRKPCLLTIVWQSGDCPETSVL